MKIVIISSNSSNRPAWASSMFAWSYKHPITVRYVMLFMLMM